MRKKPNRKQRELRRRLNAEIFQEGFEKGFELGLQVASVQLQREITPQEAEELIRRLLVNGN